jgi:hypothetical protein
VSRGAPTWRRPVYVVGAGVVSGRGVDRRGGGGGIASASTPALVVVPALSPEDEPCDKRTRKLMSRAAYLGAAAVKAALADAGWARADDAEPEAVSAIGLFMGVGASGGDMTELEAMLDASGAAAGFDLARFGTEGLRAANPLYAFQLMNNFSLCHGAILAGLEGPNAAFYSRGAGTVTALREAAFAVADGDTARALAGGADSALHPVTAAELARGGWTARGLVPAEGAALLALADAPRESGCPRLLHAEVLSKPDSSLQVLAAAALEVEVAFEQGAEAPVAVILAGWGPPALASLRAGLADRRVEVIDAAARFGETLAAAPALAWSLALGWLAARPRGRAVILSAGIDGALGVVSVGRDGV